MSSKVSFEGIGEVAATFFTNGTVKAGQVVKVSGESTVKACAAGDKFAGVAVTDDKAGCAAVQVGGFAQVSCADNTVTAGWMTLTADGNGGVKKKGSGDAGVDCLVVETGSGTITIKM